MTGPKTHATASARAGRHRAAARQRPPAGTLDIDQLLADRTTEIIVCCGSGGVGKTTTAAALGLRAAEQGRKVCVLTIDPARRLAQSMGLTELDNTPRPVKDVGDDGGTLDAMMLDMKRTFDEVVEQQASPEKAAQILNNPFYVALSSSFAGTQEYMAMEKLGQLHAQAVDEERRWDLIVVDTPPSRSALDFLDAPDRLSSMLDGRFIKLLLAPAKGPATPADSRLRHRHERPQQGARRPGADRHADVRRRVRHPVRRIPAAGRGHVRPAAGRRDRVHRRRCTRAGGHARGVLLRRAARRASRCRWPDWSSTGCTRTAPRASRLPTPSRPGASWRTAAPADQVTADLLAIHAERMRVAARESRLKRSFTAAHPGVPTVSVAALAGDVHDLDGLREIGDLLAGRQAEARPRPGGCCARR